MVRIRFGVGIVVICTVLLHGMVVYADDFGEGDIEPTGDVVWPTALATPEGTPQESGSVFPSTTFQNTPPIAHAGPDQKVYTKSLVVLDATASSDREGAIISYAWKQLSGPQVELFSPRTPHPSFSAGNIAAPYIFQLTVRDKAGASAIDVVTILVQTRPVVAPTIVPTPTFFPTPSPASVAPSLGSVATMTLVILGGVVLVGIALVVKVLRAKAVAPLSGVVRDATTHLPLPLVQVRLFDQGTNILFAEHVTDDQGRFFAFPSPSVYVLSFTKQGYAGVSRENVVIPQLQEKPTFLEIDMMALAPAGTIPLSQGPSG